MSNSLGQSVERLRIAWHRRVRPPMRKMYVGTLRRLDLAPPPRPKTPFDGTTAVTARGSTPHAQESRPAARPAEKGLAEKRSAEEGSTAETPVQPEPTPSSEPVPRSNLQPEIEFWSRTLSPPDGSDHAVERSNLTLLRSEVDRWSRLLAPTSAENRP